MGQIVISDMEDSVIQLLEMQAAAQHLTLGESLKKFLTELANNPSAHPTHSTMNATSAVEPNGNRLAQIAKNCANLALAEKFGDPVEWQREQRKDRPLFGREA
ncbi:MAG: hypothetical protein G8345_03515 [Magnetococcales bacterium]|nr:hypothetical protein [Magnetococcales bacterium]